MIKPDNGIYEYSLNKLHLLPEQALFIDDREENIEGAKKVGMHGITFKTIPDLYKNLSLLNIH